MLPMENKNEESFTLWHMVSTVNLTRAGGSGEVRWGLRCGGWGLRRGQGRLAGHGRPHTGRGDHRGWGVGGSPPLLASLAIPREDRHLVLLARSLGLWGFISWSFGYIFLQHVCTVCQKTDKKVSHVTPYNCYSKIRTQSIHKSKDWCNRRKEWNFPTTLIQRQNYLYQRHKKISSHVRHM